MNAASAAASTRWHGWRVAQALSTSGAPMSPSNGVTMSPSNGVTVRVPAKRSVASCSSSAT